MLLIVRKLALKLFTWQNTVQSMHCCSAWSSYAVLRDHWTAFILVKIAKDVSVICEVLAKCSENVLIVDWDGDRVLAERDIFFL